MFGKKEHSKRQTRATDSLMQYGIFDVPENLDDISNNFINDEDDDDDLEAELAALTGGDDNNGKFKRDTSRKPVRKQNLDVMIAESMKDISPEELSDGEDDPELLNELKMITNEESSEHISSEKNEISVTENTEQSEIQSHDTSMESMIKALQDRLQLYQIAEKKAKQENELSRARRFNRGIRTLKELLNNAQAGKPINENEIPPQLSLPSTADTNQKAPETTITESTVEVDTTLILENNAAEELAVTKSIDKEALKLLKDRQQEYKIAAIAWKRAGNMKEALQYLNIAKHFDVVISAVNAGETVDLLDMPPSPNIPVSNTTTSPTEKTERTKSETQEKSSTDTPPTDTKPSGPENLEISLKERLEACRRIKTTAESEGNSSKARRYGRICKQFEDAIKLHSRGKSIPLDELPTLPGFEPLTVTTQSNVPDTTVEANEKSSESILLSENKISSDPKTPVPPPRNQTGKRESQKMSRAEKQLTLLQQRQHELKQAALNAKKDGDIELARTYLRQAKGIDPLIEASRGGLPVDINTIPLSPGAKKELNADSIISLLDDNFTVVNTEDCLEEATGTDEQIYENLESQLMKQIKWCLCTRDHCKALGDVPGYNKWERFALNYKRDLDMLIVRKRDALPPPQHHYEMKTHTIVQSCTDLNDSDIEISIIRGVSYSKEADTYVIFEFPYPSDNPPTDGTATIKGTCNPEYEAVFLLTGIDRLSRQCQRVFKRHALKCQVWAKGCSLNPIQCCTNPRGFFRSDSILGTVTAKLQPLETQCVLHDSFPLMEGRKAAGGKLELKIRLRNPIRTKQIENITDKWLIIDY